MPKPLPPPPIAAANPIELRVRGDFLEWLAAAGGTLAVTTYNSGKLALFSAVGDRLTATYWHFPRPMGLANDGRQLALATHEHIWMFDHHSAHAAALQPAVDGDPGLPGFTLARTFATGRVDAHDLAFTRRGLLFANTRFNCVARPSLQANFGRVWKPPFVESRTRGDRCHLNGIGVRARRLAMATAFCDCDAPKAWRGEGRFDSGVLVDVRQNAVILRGLCMPHSPRWHAGGWWFCDSGRGALCRLVHLAGQAQLIASLPGFIRGLTFAAGRAIVGLSRIRKKHILDAPPVRELFPRTRSGLWLVDPESGATTGALEFIRGGREVYDVVHLPDRSIEHNVDNYSDGEG
jgi:uncharacterized protein (TIGR03032 family)